MLRLTLINIKIELTRQTYKFTDAVVTLSLKKVVTQRGRGVCYQNLIRITGSEAAGINTLLPQVRYADKEIFSVILVRSRLVDF